MNNIINGRNIVTAVITLLVIFGVGISFMRASDGAAADPRYKGEEKFGSQTGGDLAPNGYYSLGGINYWAGRIGFGATSSIACSVKNPFATSTLLSFSASVRTNPYIAQTVDVSTSTSASAGSSTLAYIKGAALAAGPSQIVWLGNMGTTTNAGLIDGNVATLSGLPFTGLTNNIIKSTEFVNFRYSTSSPASGTFPAGTCDYTFKQL